MPLYGKALTALAVTAALGGCTTGLAMKAMNGIGMCPPGAVQDANVNFSVLTQISPGEPSYVLEGLHPERQIRMDMRNGEQVALLMYRTGHPRCRNMPTESNFTPVVVGQNGLILGVGEAAYWQYRNGALTTTDVTPQSGPEEPVTLTGIWKSLPF